MALSNWVPDFDAVERVANDLALRYGASVAVRYRQIMFRPPPISDKGREPSRLVAVGSVADLLPGQKEIIYRLHWERGLSPLQISRKWGLRLALVREVLSQSSSVRMGAC